MSTTTCRWFSGLFLLLLAGFALAQEPRRFGVPGHGNLVLNVPAGWRVIDSSVAQPPSAIIRMRPPEGDRFYLQVTSIRLDPAKIAEITPEVIRERMRNVAKKVFANAWFYRNRLTGQAPSMRQLLGLVPGRNGESPDPVAANIP